MNIISLNIHGFGGLAKQKTLYDLFYSMAPDMILIQETMCNKYQALLTFFKLLSGWDFCALDASGLSRGLLTGWNPHSVCCKAFETVAGILVKAKFWGSPI